MPNRAHLKLWTLISLVVFAGLSASCATAPANPYSIPSALDARGPASAQIGGLWWLMLGLGVIIFVLVVVLMLLAIARRQRSTVDTPPEGNGDTGRSWIIWGGIVMPLIVLAVLFIFTLRTLSGITNLGDPPLTIQVVGRQWWWEVNYPQQGIATANELHIPVGVPVQILLESGDVIHSFWVPQLDGKMDAIPARTNTLTIQADQPGVYRGQCAEFCGLNHALMGFVVVAQSQTDFNRWVAEQQQPETPPTDAASIAGQQVFLMAGCAFCHAIRGVDESVVNPAHIGLGPDLTHLQSRQMLAGATLTNTKGNLAGWVVGAQHIKPGSLMPPINLPSNDLQNLLAYLESLH